MPEADIRTLSLHVFREKIAVTDIFCKIDYWECVVFMLHMSKAEYFQIVNDQLTSMSRRCARTGRDTNENYHRSCKAETLCGTDNYLTQWFGSPLRIRFL